MQIRKKSECKLFYSYFVYQKTFTLVLFLKPIHQIMPIYHWCNSSFICQYRHSARLDQHYHAAILPPHFKPNLPVNQNTINVTLYVSKMMKPVTARVHYLDIITLFAINGGFIWCFYCGLCVWFNWGTFQNFKLILTVLA